MSETVSWVWLQYGCATMNNVPYQSLKQADLLQTHILQTDPTIHQM